MTSHKRRILKLVLGMSVMIILAFFFVFSKSVYDSIWKKPLTPKLITLSANGSIRVLIHENLVDYPKTFLILARCFHWSSQLKQGTYQIKPNETLINLIYKIKKGDVYTVFFHIIEGTKLCELEEQLKNNKDFVFHSSMLSQINSDFSSLEGLLFPSTYKQNFGQSAIPVLQLAYRTMQEHLEKIWAGRDVDLPYKTPYELLIAASIIEKETAIVTERYLISGVILNRLRLHMPLQMDPTVAYGLPGCNHTIVRGHDVKIDTPYNTYLHRGLPPTPICMVSLSSLQAAAHPTRNQYLYFVANGQGGHVFSSQYQQQIRAVQQYLKDKNE